MPTPTPLQRTFILDLAMGAFPHKDEGGVWRSPFRKWSPARPVAQQIRSCLRHGWIELTEDAIGETVALTKKGREVLYSSC